MTFFARQPSRLLNRLTATRPQYSAVSLVRHQLSIPTRNGLLKPQLNLRPASSAPVSTVYPRRLLIFHSPTLETTFIATGKLAGLGVFVISCLVVAPNVYLDEKTSNLMVPAVIIGAGMFLPIFHWLTRSFVANIFIETPAWARRSREALVTFTKRLPHDTPLEIETLGLLPWPRRKALRVSDLRNLPQTLGRIANLEQVTAADTASKIPKSMRWSLEQFYARPSPSRWEKSRAPDVWPLVLDYISKNSVKAVPKSGVSPEVAARAVRPAADVQKNLPASPTAMPRSRQSGRRA